MSIRDRLYDLRREREQAYDLLVAARADLKRVKGLPPWPGRDAEVKTKKDEIDRLAQEHDRLRGLISVLSGGR
jgi:hypothetical protein